MNPSRIVLIEDNPGDVMLVQIALQENQVDCEMTTFNNGEDALRALCPQEGVETNTLVPDAILLDLNTPKSDGFEVLIRLKHTPRMAHVPVAIITSSDAESDKARSIHLGASRYIRKPSQLDEFVATVGEAVQEMLNGSE